MANTHVFGFRASESERARALPASIRARGGGDGGGRAAGDREREPDRSTAGRKAGAVFIRPNTVSERLQYVVDKILFVEELHKSSEMDK